MPNNTATKYYIFTDGSTLGNHLKDKSLRRGGYGVYCPFNESLNVSKSLENDPVSPTNIRAEMYAIIESMNIFCNYCVTKKLNSDLLLVIVTDSKFTIDLVTKWLPGWKKRGWKKADRKAPENLELVKKLDNAIEKFPYDLSFRHVNSHISAPDDKNSSKYRLWYGNEMADKLATDASNSY